MEDNTKKKTLSDEELMDVSGGISGYPWDMVCPSCGTETDLVPVATAAGYQITCSACGHKWIGRSLKSVIAIEM